MTNKRIAIIIDTLNGGGAEKVCLSLFNGMLARDIDVHMIVLKKKCDYEIPLTNNIHFVFEESDISLSNGLVQKKAAKKLTELINTLGAFDAYLSNLDVTNIIVAKASLLNCFYVIHNSIEKTLGQYNKVKFIKYWQQRKAIKVLNGKRLITVSKGIENEITHGSLITPFDIRTIYNPINIDFIRNEANKYDQAVPENDYILFIGRIAKQKRVDILIKAFQYVKSDIDLVVLTNNSKKLDKVIKKENINNKNIVSFNFKQNPYPLIKHAKTLVLSSDFEGLGMVLIEALACNTPVVSTNCQHGPSEILLDDLAQFLCPVGDVKQLAEKIDSAINYQVSDAKILEKVNTDNVINKYLEFMF